MANGGFIGVDRTPFAGTLISDFTGSGTFNRSATTGTVLVVAGGVSSNKEIRMTAEMLNLLGCNKDNFKKLLRKMNYKITENNGQVLFKYNPINPPFTSISTREVKLPTTSNPKTEVPVNTNHKIVNGISPINTPTRLETNPFTNLNTESILFLFFCLFCGNIA